MKVFSKKSLIIFACVAIILVSMVLIFSGNNSKTEEVFASAEVLTSNVTRTRIEGKPSTIKGIENVMEGDIVATDNTGTALIEGEHKTYLDRDTSLTVKHIAQGQTSFTLGLGRLWSRVEKLLEQGEYFEIETGNARAAVRGTSFGVSTTATTTKLLVAEGYVAIALRSATGAVLSYTEEIVPAGKKALVTGGDFEISDITKEDMDSWFMMHNPGWVRPATESPVKVEIKVPVQNFALPREEKPEEKIEAVGTVKSIPTSTLLSILSVVPAEVASTGTVTIHGKGFTKIKSLILGKITISNYKILSDDKIQFTVREAGLTPGIYDVSLIDLFDSYVVKSKALRVLESIPVENTSTGGSTNQNQ